MIVSYFRSSMLGSWSYCQHKTFLTYNLGFQEPPNKKTVMGTATHAVMESLAIGKKYLQENPDSKFVIIEHEQLGRMTFSVEDFFKIEKLSDSTVDEINKSMKSKTIYKEVKLLKYGHERMGQDCVNAIITRSCQVYSVSCEQRWMPADFRDVNNWSWIFIDYLGGAYDPRKRNIIEPEKSFDIELNLPWATYEHIINGEKKTGKLRLKGTMDLITRMSPGTIEIVDWKTGQRIDWGDNCKEKDYEYLCNDKQLLFYFYVASQLYPDDEIYITIFFCRHGGPFTIPFDRTRLPEIEQKLMDYFQEIKSCELPKMVSESQTDFRCTTLCRFFKDGNSCKKIHDLIKEKNMQYVIDNHKEDGFNVDSYVDPGKAE